MKGGAGKFRWPISIQQKTIGKDVGGRPVETWVNAFNPRAARVPIPLRSKEVFAAAAVTAETAIRYEIRYRPGITSDMRLVDRGRIYQITAVLDDIYDDQTETHLLTKEFTNG